MPTSGTLLDEGDRHREPGTTLIAAATRTSIWPASAHARGVDAWDEACGHHHCVRLVRPIIAVDGSVAMRARSPLRSCALVSSSAANNQTTVTEWRARFLDGVVSTRLAMSPDR